MHTSHLGKQTCPGCLRTFSIRRGLLSHLRQATNQRCKRVLEQIEEDVPGIYGENALDEQESSDHENTEVEEDPEVFGGDFFGNDYAGEDFPGWDETSNSDEEYEEEDSETENR
jgi:hypothetical protein